MKYRCGENEARERARRVRALGLDVDGVLSDGSLYFTSAGEEMKAFNALDGQGLKMLMQAGIEVVIITSRASPILARRSRDLGIRHLYQGAEDKLEALQDYLARSGFEAQQFAFVGDDLVDLPVLLAAGLACSPPNGHEEVRKRCHIVTSLPGGHGAVREITDFLLRCQGLYARFLPS